MNHAALLPFSASLPPGVSLWAGRSFRGAVIAFFLLDAAMKLPPLAVVTDTMAELGWPADPTTARSLGALMLATVGLYAWRPTAILGAILMTAYLGGAVATHARVGSPLLSHTLFGVYVGALAWAGLWLRDPRLRALLPIGR